MTSLHIKLTQASKHAADDADATQTTSSPLVEVPSDESLATMAKAIGHPARISILRLLAHRDTCVTGEVVAQLPLAQSTVSEHLRILREAGLIQGEFEGPRTRYCINPTGIAALRAGICEL